MKHLFPIYVFVFLAINLSAQNVDSLLMVYNSDDSKASLTAAQNIMNICYENGDCDTLYTFSAAMKDYEVEALTLAPLSNYFFNHNKYEESYYLSLRALEPAKKLKDETMLGLCYSNLAACNQLFGNFDKAIEYAHLCYDLDVRSGNASNISSSLNNLAVIVLSTHHPEESKEYIDRAVAIERKLGKTDVLAIRLGVASEVYMALGKYDEALAFATEAYDVNMQTGNMAKAAIRMCQIAAVHQAKGDDENAVLMYQQARTSLKQAGNYRSLSICMNALGNIAVRNGDEKEAQKCYLEAIEASRICGYTYQELKASTALAHLLDHSQPQIAVQYYRLSEVLSDSILNVESERQINNFNIQYQTSEKEHQIVLQQEQLSKQKTMNYLMILVLFFCVLSIFALILFVRTQRKRNKELKEMNLMKSKFFSIISHDLKNPVYAQKNVLDLICQNFDELPKELLKEQCVELKNSSSALTDLLNNLLNWSRLETGRMSLNPIHVDMQSVFNEVHAELKMQLDAKQISLVNQLPDYIIVNADRNMTVLVLRNLVGNAIKFSNPGTQIQISAQRVNESWKLSVQNQGVGMSAEAIALLFKLHSGKSSEGTAGEKGTGLGLLMCREMVEKNGGIINIESEMNHGTNVSFTLKSA